MGGHDGRPGNGNTTPPRRKKAKNSGAPRVIRVIRVIRMIRMIRVIRVMRVIRMIRVIKMIRLSGHPPGSSARSAAPC